jgi:SSS family solute:Na+ symporter
MKHLQALDYIVVMVYFCVVFTIGLYMSRRQKTTADYFVARRRIPGWAVAFTMMGTMISSVTFVGHPGAVFAKSFWLEVGSLGVPVVLLFVVFFIVPFYRRAVGVSAYEYLEKRFGYFARFYASFAFVILRLMDMGFTLYTTAIVTEVMTGWPMDRVIIGLGLFTMFYTMIGGIEGVIWTDVVQGFILIGGCVLMVAMLLFESGHGPLEVIGTAWDGGKFNLGNFDAHPATLYGSEYTFWMLLLCGMFGLGRSYVTEQNMVQRYLVARTDREAQRGALFGAFVCLPIWLTFAFIGALMWAFYQISGQALPDEIVKKPDSILPYFVANQLPTGVVGLILAAILAVTQSSTSADLNSVATVVTTDYFGRWLPKTKDKTQLLFGRAVVLVAGIVITWVALQLVQTRGRAVLETGAVLGSIIAGGTLGLFGLGFLCRRATKQGTYIGMVACLLYTAWATITGPLHDKLGLQLEPIWRFNMNPLLIGMFTHFVLFGVGYVASLLCGEKRADLKGLTVWDARELMHKQRVLDDKAREDETGAFQPASVLAKAPAE